MWKKFCTLLLCSSLLTVASAQIYNPYNTPSPTFSTLNNYYNPTPYPYNYYNPNANNYYSNNNDVKIRIWPYVIGQYLYPSYYNNNINDPYASFNNPNWQSYYANVYQNQNNWGKK